MLRLKPTKGLKVRDPISRQFVPEGGIDVPDSVMGGVPDSAHWQQLLRFGDVEIVKADPPAKSDAPADKVDAPSKPAS